MYTLEQQIGFYSKLTNEKRDIYAAFTIKTTFSNLTDLRKVLSKTHKHTAKSIDATIKEALKMGIIKHNKTANTKSVGKYYASYPFTAYMYSTLTEYGKKLVVEESKSFRFSALYKFSNPKDVSFLIFNILHGEPDLNLNTNKNIFKNSNLVREIDFLNVPYYGNNLSKLDSTSLYYILAAEISKCQNNFEPIANIENSHKKLTQKIGDKHKIYLENTLHLNTNILMGHFSKAYKYVNTSTVTGISLNGAQLFHKGKKDKAGIAFEEGLKLSREENNNKNLMMFTDYKYNYIYFCYLLSLPVNEAADIARKILSTFYLANYKFLYADLFLPIVQDMAGMKIDKKKLQEKFFGEEYNENKLSTLHRLAIAYIAKITPPEGLKQEIYDLIVLAYNNGHYLAGYEVSYATTQWFEDKAFKILYEKYQSVMKRQPSAYLINKISEWEKSLELISAALGEASKLQSKTKQEEKSQRVVYTYDAEENEIRPVLQTLNAKGKWSKGRNISLKTFQEGKTNGMSEKDLRISRYVRSYRQDGSDKYELSIMVATELIGHPLIFMSDNIDIPIEFVEAKPIIKVTKKRNGYELKSDIKSFINELIIEKETNTRYKIYVLDSQVQIFLKLLTNNDIVVPKEGVKKLTSLLGEMSKHAIVQSNLITSSEKDGFIVKEVEPDSRIRIQLLPIGDGLKAELFVKPFDKTPPYSKPASGGRVLITNIDGEQFQVKRDFDIERQNYYSILDNIQNLVGVDTCDDLIKFDNPLDSLFLLDIISEHQDISVVEWPEGERLRIRAKADFPSLSIRVKTKTNWFELDGELKIDDNTVISMQHLLGLVAKSHDRFIELSKGEFITLSEELRKRLNELNSYANNSKDGIKINKYATLALDGLFNNLEDIKADKEWQEFKNTISSKNIEDVNTPATLQAELRPYQEDGYRWMTRLSEMGAGACLADDMGLGKTLQTLALLLNRIGKGPALVVCPVSIIGNWISEANRFAPILNMKVLSSSDRNITIDNLTEGDVLVTSYGLLQSEENLFSKKEFATIILDEAHIIKNYATKTSRAIMNLKGDFRLALTGTPLQNHMGEIWNLFNFINPGLLGSLKDFNETFIKPDDEKSKKMLRKLIKPFILRRTKSAVLDELPPKTEIIKKIQLSDNEMAFYEALRRQALENIEKDDGRQGAKHIKALAEITKLRQASCNPLLVDSNIGIESSKLNTFLEIVDELIENKHRALVFSQFVSHLSIVKEALDKKGIKYKYLDGSTPMKERDVNVNDFQKGNGDLFLISLKAGGLGLNLTAADFVIHLDPWWNPAIEDQASDRAHRFGQKRPVTIYRLVSENTIEEKIINLHNTKRDLAQSLLEGTDQAAKMSFTELIDLIKG